MPSESDAIPNPGFEPQVFWELHKAKIIIYGVLLVVALLVFSIYQYTSQRRTAAAGSLLAQAGKAEDYRQIMAKYPRTVAAGNAHLLLAKELREAKQYEEATSLLREFTQKFPEHPLVSAGWLSLAETLKSAGKTDEAADTYQQIASKFPDSFAAPLAAMEQADLLKSNGKTDEAKRAYENIIAQYPESMIAQQATREMRLLRK
ncbi:MAG: hypothetical protein QOD99_2942 [Chthoniobacter sp.]|jgi:TolA-binding protein|nr:hypothetical protein [Chthoniobacter sp.]